MEIEELEDLNSVTMSNERLLCIEASEIANLRELISNLWQLNQTPTVNESGSVLQRTFNLSSTSELDFLLLEGPTLLAVLERKIAINAMRYAFFVFVRPVLLLLVLLLELLTLAAFVRLTSARYHCKSTPETPTALYLVLHVVSVVIENTLFNGVDWLVYVLDVEHPATSHQLLCSFWWLGLQVLHAFQLWILMPATIQTGSYLFSTCIVSTIHGKNIVSKISSKLLTEIFR